MLSENLLSDDLFNDSSVRVFQADVPEVTADRVLRIQGYTDLEKVRRPIREAAVRAVDSITDHTNPSVAWRRLEIRSLIDARLSLEDGVAVECDAFARFIKNSEHVVVFAMTIGSEFDQAVQSKINDDELLDAVLMESAGWLAVEAVTKQWTILIRDLAASSGWLLTRRMSPGYTYQIKDRQCEWPLEQQQDLFVAFGETEIPVHLMDSSAMLPKMSRSGLIGLRPTG